MLRLPPTVITLTTGEIKDAETRRRFRRHLRKADAQQSRERKRMEQNQQSVPGERSSSTSTPQIKDGAGPIARHRLEAVLTHSPPQSQVVPVHRVAATDPPKSSEVPDRFDNEDDQSVDQASDGALPAARPLAMTPRRLPPGVLSTSSLRRRNARGPPSTNMVVPTPASPPESHEGFTGMSGIDRQTGHSMSSPVDEGIPLLPPPFSQKPRQFTAELEASRLTDSVQASRSQEETLDPVEVAELPPVTPPRRSSWGATSRHQAASGIRVSIVCPYCKSAADPNHAKGVPGLTSATDTAEDTDNGRPHSSEARSPNRHNSNVVIIRQSTSTESGRPGVAVQSPVARLGRLRIYDDSLPPTGQPETPQNLPEARHQSRLRGSYTVPARHGSAIQNTTPATSRRRQSRSELIPVPAGMVTPGLLGLYGGIENGDDVQLFEQAERESEARHSRTSPSWGFE